MQTEDQKQSEKRFSNSAFDKGQHQGNILREANKSKEKQAGIWNLKRHGSDPWQTAKTTRNNAKNCKEKAGT